jgi:hypothetical protein
MTDFDKWYAERFGMLLENEQQERMARAALQQIFNSVVEEVALKFDAQSFTEFDGIQAAGLIRAMKDKDENTR